MKDTWSKGHIRLASAYIALGGHSNDVCNALQRAVSLDPSNQTARQMLLKELRRDHHPQQPSAPPEHMDDSARSRNGNDVPPTTNANATADVDDHDDDGMNVEQMSWMDRIQLYWVRAVSWYYGQPEDVKTLLKVICGIVVLYIMFGGRFGLSGSGFSSTQKGNYGRGNVYDRYHGGKTNSPYEDVRGATAGPGGNNRGGTAGAQSRGRGAGAQPRGRGAGRGQDSSYDTNRRTTSSYANDDYGYQPPRKSASQSFHFPNLFDGSVPSMICLAGIAYLCHLNGINPFQVIMMMNMMAGGRRRGMGGMGGMGMAGMGYGMARNAGVFGGQPRGRAQYY